MAIIKLGNSKSASRAINYAEKRATNKSAVGCSSDYAKTSFKAVRMAYGKDDKIQAHTIIQSFKPGEVSPALANEIGFDLVKLVAEGHQAVVYTHTDTEHIHNHIIINAVNTDTGKKYRSTKNQLKRVLEKSNELCAERGLSTFEREKDKKTLGDRHTQAEIEIRKTGRESWKENIRNAVVGVKNSYLISSLEEYQEILKKEHDIDLIKRGKTLTYAYNEVAADDNSPLKTRKVRGSKLGADYELEQLNQYFEQQKEIKHNNDLLEQQKLLDEQQNQVSVRSNIEIREEYEKIEINFRTSTSDIATREDFLHWQKVMKEQEARHDSFYTEQALVDLNNEIEQKEQEELQKQQEIERTVELAADKQRVDQEAVVQEKPVVKVVEAVKKVDTTNVKQIPNKREKKIKTFDEMSYDEQQAYLYDGESLRKNSYTSTPRKQKEKDDGLEF